MFTIVALLIAAILLTLVSGCKKQTCTVTFKAVGEEDIVITTEYGKSITPPKVPEKIGNDGKWDVAYFGKITENFTVNAVYETRGLKYTSLDNGTGFEVSKGEMDENTQELFIPEKYNGERVARVMEDAFRQCRSIKTVTFSENLTEIAPFAFDGCVNLTSVNFSQSLMSIGEFAFYSCARLEEVVFPASLTEIGDAAFSSCLLKKIVFPEGNLSTIGRTAFSGASLQSVIFPKNLYSIGECAFTFCFHLENVVFSEGSRVFIGENAFSYCEFIKSVVLPPFSVSEIGKEAFSNCKKLQSITIPTGVEKLAGFEDWTAEQTIYVQGHAEKPNDWQNDWCGGATVVWNA